MTEPWATEIRAGTRFSFGRNWRQFLVRLNDDRIDRAVRSLRQKLRMERLRGLRFLDVGCGSGLFSLAARRMGAEVRSFDFDPQSVACTEELKARYFPGDVGWTIERGSILDGSFLSTLGRFEIVYSWGVLHHTGEMWRAIRNAAALVAPGGRFFIAIYNDAGGRCRRWRTVKRIYNRSGEPLRSLILFGSMLRVWGPRVFREGTAWLRSHGMDRGMSAWTDLVDWVGGYPYEFARPQEIVEALQPLGFSLQEMTTCGDRGTGCNEFVFAAGQGRPASPA